MTTQKTTRKDDDKGTGKVRSGRFHTLSGGSVWAKVRSLENDIQKCRKLWTGSEAEFVAWAEKRLSESLTRIGSNASWIFDSAPFVLYPADV